MLWQNRQPGSGRFAEYGKIITLGLPILVGQAGGIATGFADNIMVGRFATDALASASFCNGIFNLALLASMGFAYGVTPLAGALYATSKSRDIGALVRNALVLNLAYTAVLLLIMLAVYANLDRMGQPAALLPLIRPYFLLCAAAMLPLAVFNVIAQFCYAINNTRLPMWILLGANLLNIAGNWLLIGGNLGCPRLGLMGAGLATLAARTLGPLVLFAVFMTAGAFADYRRAFLRASLKRHTVAKLWRTSLPVSLQMAFETGAFSLSAVMAGMLGKEPMAAFQIILTIGMLGFCIYYAVGAAVAVRVSNAAGAGDTGGMRRAAVAGYRITLSIMVVSSAVFWFAGRPIMSVFTTDPAVLGLAVSVIFPLVLYQFADATQVNYANALRGTANVSPMLWVSFVSYIAVGLPSTWLMCFTMGMGFYGIILSFSVSLFMAAALYHYFFKRTLRKLTFDHATVDIR